MQNSAGLVIQPKYSDDQIATLRSSLRHAENHALTWPISTVRPIPYGNMKQRRPPLYAEHPVVKQSAIALMRAHKQRDQMYQNEFLKAKMKHFQHNMKRKQNELSERQNQSVSSMNSLGESNNRHRSVVRHSRQSRNGSSSASRGVTFSGQHARHSQLIPSKTPTNNWYGKNRLTYAPYRIPLDLMKLPNTPVKLKKVKKISSSIHRIPSARSFNRNNIPRIYKVPSRVMRFKPQSKETKLQDAIFQMLQEISVRRQVLRRPRRRKRVQLFESDSLSLSSEDHRRHSRAKRRSLKHFKRPTEEEEIVSSFTEKSYTHADHRIRRPRRAVSQPKKVEIIPTEVKEVPITIGKRPPTRGSSPSSPRHSRPAKKPYIESTKRARGKLMNNYDAVNRDILKTIKDPEIIDEFLHNIKQLATKQCTLFRKRFKVSEKVPDLNDPFEVERYLDSVELTARKARQSIARRHRPYDTLSLDLEDMETSAKRIGAHRKRAWYHGKDYEILPKLTDSASISDTETLELSPEEQSTNVETMDEKVTSSDKIKARKPYEHPHTERIRKVLPVYEPQGMPSYVSSTTLHSTSQILKNSDSVKDVASIEQEGDLVPLHQRTIKMPLEQHYMLKKDVLAEKKSAMELKTDAEPSKEPQLIKSFTKLTGNEKNKHSKKQQVEKNYVKLSYTETNDGEIVSLEQAQAMAAKEKRESAKKKHLYKRAQKETYTEEGEQKAKGKVRGKAKEKDKEKDEKAKDEDKDEDKGIDDQDNGSAQTNLKDTDKDQEILRLKEPKFQESSIPSSATENIEEIMSVRQLYTQNSGKEKPLVWHHIGKMPLIHKHADKKSDLAIALRERKVHMPLDIRRRDSPFSMRKSDQLPMDGTIVNKIKKMRKRLSSLKDKSKNPPRGPMKQHRRVWEPEERPPLLEPETEEKEVEEVDNLTIRKSKYDEFLVVHRKPSVMLPLSGAAGFPFVSPVSTAELQLLSPEEFYKLFTGLPRTEKSIEYMKTSLELVKDNLPLTYKYREDQVRRFLYGSDVGLSELDNISIDDIDLNSFLNYPYGDKYVDEQIEPKTPPKKPQFDTIEHKTSDLKRKKASKTKAVVVPAKPPCCICNTFQKFKPIKDNPMIMQMKTEMKRLELKAYIREQQVLHKGPPVPGYPHFLTCENPRFLVPCQKPRNVCNHNFMTNVFNRNLN